MWTWPICRLAHRQLTGVCAAQSAGHPADSLFTSCGSLVCSVNTQENLGKLSLPVKVSGSFSEETLELRSLFTIILLACFKSVPFFNLKNSMLLSVRVKLAFWFAGAWRRTHTHTASNNFKTHNLSSTHVCASKSEIKDFLNLLIH